MVAALDCEISEANEFTFDENRQVGGMDWETENTEGFPYGLI